MEQPIDLIALSKEYIAKMYQACNDTQTKVLIKHVDFINKTITPQGVLALHLVACSDWKNELKEKFPEAFKTSYVINVDSFELANDEFQDALEKIGIEQGTVQILHGAATEKQYQDHGIYIKSCYDIEINQTCTDAFELILRHGSGKLVVNHPEWRRLEKCSQSSEPSI